MTERKYGWRRDKLDHRDVMLKVTEYKPRPSKYEIPLMPPVMQQGQLGACTSHAICSAYLAAKNKQINKLTDFVPSRLALYYEERCLEGTTDQDAGAQIRDGIKCCNKFGLAQEKLWPYDIAKFTVRPPPEVYRDGLQHQALQYARVPQALESIKQVLASGHCVVIGFSVFESFESSEVAKTGVVPMPTLNEKPLGGHAVTIFGYSDYDAKFKVRNSWGDTWGDKGNFYMPYPYVENPNLASDFWMMEVVE